MSHTKRRRDGSTMTAILFRSNRRAPPSAMCVKMAPSKERPTGGRAFSSRGRSPEPLASSSGGATGVLVPGGRRDLTDGAAGGIAGRSLHRTATAPFLGPSASTCRMRALHLNVGPPGGMFLTKTTVDCVRARTTPVLVLESDSRRRQKPDSSRYAVLCGRRLSTMLKNAETYSRAPGQAHRDRVAQHGRREEPADRRRYRIRISS